MSPATEKKYKPDTVRAAFSAWAYGEESPDGEQRMFCPVCEDPTTSNSPSAMMNADEGVWNCLKGNHGGKIYALVQDLKKERGFDIRSASMRGRNTGDPGFAAKRDAGLARAGKATAPLPTAEDIDSWNERLLSTPVALKKFTSERGLSNATIIKYKIGWDGQRYTFPIYGPGNELLNVRRYKINAATHADKMLNIPGHGTAQIYGIEILLDETVTEVVLSEGETDRLLALQNGIPTVTHTAGAQTFRGIWGPLFAGKIVYICYDNDEAGKKGATKAAAILKEFAEAVYKMDIPLPGKGADITDYLHKEGHSAEDFLQLMKEASERGAVSETRSNAPVADRGRPTTLVSSMAQDLQSETMELTVSVAGKQQEPYTAPKRIEITCDMSKGAACTNCPVSFKNGAMDYELRPDDEALFRFVDVPETRRKTLLREVSGARCSDRAEFEVAEEYHIEELLVQPSVDDRREDETEQPVRRTAFSVSTHNSPVNQKVRLVGRNVPDPKSGKLRFVAWKNEPVSMDIDRFTLTDEIRAQLMQFRPREAQTPLERSLEIAEDMALNVTHIYGRDILHVAYDLVWHSVQSFKIFDLSVVKGWLEMAVIGDTRTGKTEIAQRLSRHYRSGRVISCEGMTFAGLVGGVQQIDGRWHMTWGIVPMNDRRLVFLDEMSGLADKNVIDQMSSIRSSGVAQITKIQSEETSARTRLIWAMNPADGSNLSDHAEGGMEAIRTVVPNAEDIARFDYVCSAAKGEVPDSVINSSFAEMHSPRYPSEACENLVKWAWSLRRADVLISERAASAAIDAAKDLGSRYVSDPPLIQSENVRFKVLRIACALAARTFSCNAKGQLMVKAEHVKDAVRFLDLVYNQESMGYARKSRRVKQNTERARGRKENVRVFLQEYEDSVLLTLRMVGGSTFKKRDLEDFGGMDRDVAKQVVQKLLSWRMVHLKTRGDIGMDPMLLEVIRELDDAE